jgi:hypothetical protein
MRIARSNLRDNPHIVAHWFHFRFKTFKEMVLNKKFRIVNAWDRYEWQGRGSTHNYGVFWLEAEPSPEVEEVDDATRTEFANWWGLYISAWNPEPRHGAYRVDEIAAVALPLDRQENRVSHLSAIVNRVQRHVCARPTAQGYCRCSLPVSLSITFTRPASDCEASFLTVLSPTSLPERSQPELL